MTDVSQDSKEMYLVMALLLMVFYLQGGENHNEFLADPPPKKTKRQGWKSKETFVDLSSYLKPDFELLNALEEEGWIEQPQKFKKWRHYSGCGRGD
jgi:hypothetical protein